MRAGHELFKILQRAIIRVNGVIILDGIRTAKFALAEFFTDGVDRHRPEDVHAQVVQFIKFGRDAVEIAGGGKITRIDFVNRAGAQPVGRGPRGGPETSASAFAPAANKASATPSEKKPLSKRCEFIITLIPVYALSTQPQENATRKK